MYTLIAHQDEHYDQKAHVPVHARSRITALLSLCAMMGEQHLNMHVQKQPLVSKKKSDVTILSTAETL